MGTKNNPGSFDCYENAEPDEPMFVLLGRDGDAPALVEAWADARSKAGESVFKVQEARDCARAMREFRAKRVEERCLKAAKDLAVEYGISYTDALALCRMVGGDANKASVAANLFKRGNMPIGVLGTAIDLGRP